jgi:hypothetical protein
MAAMTNYLENKLIDQIFRGVTYTFPGTLYVGLLTSAPSDASSGTEVSGNNYGRVGVTANTSNWAATDAAGSTANPSGGTSGTTSNNGVLSFNTPSGNWGTITHFGIYDASTSGNLLFWGVLSAQKAVFSGDAVSIQISQLQIQIDD